MLETIVTFGLFAVLAAAILVFFWENEKPVEEKSKRVLVTTAMTGVFAIASLMFVGLIWPPVL